LIRRALVLTGALLLPLGLVSQTAGAGTTAKPGPVVRAATWHGPEADLPARRAQVHHDLSLARERSAARVSRAHRKAGSLKGRQLAADAIHEHALAVDVSGQHTGPAKLKVVKAAGQHAAGSSSGPSAAPKADVADDIMASVLNVTVTGPSGFVAGNCNPFFDSGCTTGQYVGVVYPSEPLTISADISTDDPSGASHQVQVSWSAFCDTGEVLDFSEQVVTAPSGYATGDSVSVTTTVPASVMQTCGGIDAPEFGNAALAAGAVITDISNGLPASNDALMWDFAIPAGELYGCLCGDSAGPGQAEEFVADPVSTATGQYADSFADASLKSPGYPLTITRSYASGVTTAGPMGPGWSLPWQTSLSPQSNGNVSLTAEDGSQYVYTSNGNGGFTSPGGARSVLAEVTDSSGTLTGYTLTAADHHVLHFNPAGQVMAENDATGRGLTFHYNGSGQIDSITDAAGQAVSLSYTSGLLTQIGLPNGQAIGYGYTGGQLTSVTDPDGNTTTYGYNPAGLLSSVKDPNGNYVIRNVYNSSGQVTSQQNGTGDTTTFSYTTTSGGLQETDVTDPDGGVSSYVSGGGMLQESVDPLGKMTTYAYNQFLQQTQVTDPLGGVTTMAYDNNGDLTGQTDPLGHGQQWTYDGNGNPLTYTDADDDQTTFTYNSMDETTSVTSASGGKTSYTYDSDGNLTGSTDPRGNAAGANATAYITTYAYNGSGQLTSVTNPDGYTTAYTYDAEGYQQTVTDARSQVTRYGYDGDEHLTSVTAADGGVAKSVYDPAGELVSQTDPDQNTVSYTYDADDRVVKTKDALGNSVTYGYDGDGNQVDFTDARDITSTTTFDADDQPKKITYSDGTPSVTYSYDANGDITGVTDAAGSRTLAYNAAGNLTSQTGPGSGSFSYGYDAAGNVTSRTYPDGTKVAYTYDQDGRISALANGSATTSYSYDPAGNLVSTTEPNGVAESRSYDGAGQLTGITDTHGGSTLDSYGLTLNGDGQPTQVTVTQAGTAQASRYYGYDSDGRLASACYSSSSAACSAGSAGTATGAAPDPAAPSIPTGAATSGMAGKCLDDSANSTTAGGKVDIYSCNGGAAEVWAVQSDGTIRINGQCLDVKGAGTANGSLIDHYTCVGQANQQWKVGSNHSVVNPVSGMCLSDPNASTTDGTQLIIANCNGQPQQQWRLPSSSPAPAGALSSGLAGKCLDDKNGSASNSNPIDISSCTGGAAQDWTVEPDGTVRAFGKCLDIKGNGTANSSLVDLYSCLGQANQVWEPAPGGYLVNPQSGKCLDDPGSSTTNGTQLDIYTCVAGASNEVWTLPSTTVPATPTGVKVTAGAASAAVTWTPPSSTGGSALTGYTVTAAPGGVTATAGPYDTTATVAGLTAGTAYTFTLTASTGVGSATTSATTAVTPGNETSYGYDQAGNITSSETDGLTTTNSYNAAEELTKSVTGATTVTDGYDADGNLTSTGNQTFAYNGAGQLSSAATPAGKFSYTYDYAGDLSSADLGSTQIQHTVWDTNNPLPQPVEDTAASGATTADYVYGPAGRLASVTAGDGSYQAITDWLGGVAGLVDSSGTQVTSTSYGAYGVSSTSDLATGVPSSSIGYAGSYALPGGTGLDDMRARDYDPATASFTSVDPLRATTEQAYLYSGDSPTSATDPSGQTFVDPGGGGGSLTVEEILQDPWILEGMNPQQLLDALGGVPQGFTELPGRSVSVAPGWKLNAPKTKDGAVQIKWSRGSKRPDHPDDPYWRVSRGGQDGFRSPEIPAGDWPDGPAMYTQKGGGACDVSYTGLACGPGDPLFGDGGEGDGEDPFFGEDIPGLLADVSAFCSGNGG
jgi:RHS repeat-associated protein